MKDIFEKHKLKIAKETLKMTPIMANIIGGMTYEEAKQIVKGMERQKHNK